VLAGRHNEHVRAAQELLVMGAANVAAGFTQAFSVGASGARTAVNEAMGARTQIAGLRRGPGRPDPALPDRAGAVSADRRARRGHRRRRDRHRRPARLARAGGDRPGRGRDRGWDVACVVFFGVLEALVVAVGLSVVDTVRRSARPYDAVLGWVPRLEDYRNVALHSLRDDESRRASVPAARFRGGPVQGEPIHVLPRRRDHRWRGEWFVCARRRQPSTRRQQ
jgi:sulfate permease, SulP family